MNQVVQKAYLSRSFFEHRGKSEDRTCVFSSETGKEMTLLKGDIRFSPLSFFDGEKTSGQNAVVKEKRKKYCVNDETDKVFSDTFFPLTTRVCPDTFAEEKKDKAEQVCLTIG